MTIIYNCPSCDLHGINRWNCKHVCMYINGMCHHSKLYAISPYFDTFLTITFEGGCHSGFSQMHHDVQLCLPAEYFD